MAERCTEQSFSPCGGVMKPKPFVSLNHFTVPVVRIAELLNDVCNRSTVLPYVPTTCWRDWRPHAGTRPTITALCRERSDAGRKKGAREMQAPNPSELNPEQMHGVRR